jgi:hypothetical protein
MKDSISSLFESAKNAGAFIKEKAAAASQATMDSILHSIEKWLEEFPKIESYGLQIRNFGFIMGLSPALEVEMVGSKDSFPPERLNEIIAENKSTSLTGMIFSAIRTTYKLHAKVAQEPEDPLIIKIRLSISPEIAVYIGRPRVG